MSKCQYCQKNHDSSKTSCKSFSYNEFSNHFSSDITKAALPQNESTENFIHLFNMGKISLEHKNYEEACNFLREAIKLCKTLPSAIQAEITVRSLLAEALEAQSLFPEAADQYRLMAQESNTEGLREHCLKKWQDLIVNDSIPFEKLFKEEKFRSLTEQERRYLPLYCSGCKRYLDESEVQNFRRAKIEFVSCWCGELSRPLVKEVYNIDEEFSPQYKNLGQRYKAIHAANSELVNGKKRLKAISLALTFGWCGIHKFYLGDSVSGWIYLFWFWTLVPMLLSWYEAFLLSQMSLVTFNMTYNLDIVLEQTTPEIGNKESKEIDTFSLDRANMISLSREEIS